MPAPKPIVLPCPVPFDEAIRRVLTVKPEPKTKSRVKKRGKP